MLLLILTDIVVVPLPQNTTKVSDDLYKIGDFDLTCTPDCVANVTVAYDVYKTIFFPKGAPTP